MSWETIRLGEFLTLKRGYDLPTSQRYDGNVPVVSSSGITGYHNEIKVCGPGVVTGRYGTLGEVFFIREDFWPLNTALYVQDFKENDPLFTAYFLKYILGGTVSDKAAVPGVNRNDLHAKTIKVTREHSQQLAIASILSTYDDLIENNRRRIQLLEQAARLLYKEWFVYLRFPGHEHVKITDGVPEGWEKSYLSEIADITMGQSPKSIYYNEECNGLPFHQGVSNFGNRFPLHRTYCTFESRLAEKGDILLSVRAPVGRINITLDRIIIGRGLSAIRSLNDQQNFLFYSLKEFFFREDIIGGGTIFAAITKNDLYNIKLLQPAESIVKMLMEYARPIDQQIINLHHVNFRLSNMRDLLLPRLMNGDLAV